jgi:hypothetical protein
MPVPKSTPALGFAKRALAGPTTSTLSRLSGQVGGQGVQPQAVRPSALNARFASGLPPKGTKPSATTLFSSPESEGAKPNHSQAHVGGKPYVPGQSHPETLGELFRSAFVSAQTQAESQEKIKEFLGSTLSNNRYESMDQLQLRAENFLRHIEAEKKILAQTTEGLKDPQSPVYQQATWMAALERLNWKHEASLDPSDREQLAREIERGEGFEKDSPFRSIRVSASLAKALSMMLEKQEGPLTEAQALAGFEMAQLGTVIASRVGIEERMKIRRQYRVDADRQGTSMTQSPDGVDLSADLGTQLRDQHGLPVMTGTSGSSSDAALSPKFASLKTGVPWTAPGLSEQQAQHAIADLGLQFFRGDDSTPSRSIAASVNRLRTAAHLPPMHVDSQHVFSHSYPEIDAALRLTLQGKSGWNKQAMQAATLASAQRLADVADELALEAKPATSDDKPARA